jgi:hypothetical protein
LDGVFTMTLPKATLAGLMVTVGNVMAVFFGLAAGVLQADIATMMRQHISNVDRYAHALSRLQIGSRLEVPHKVSTGCYLGKHLLTGSRTKAGVISSSQPSLS